MLVLVTGNVQITNNAALLDDGRLVPEAGHGLRGTWTSSTTTFWLCSARRSRFQKAVGLVTGYVSIYNNTVLPSLGSAFHGHVTMTAMTTGHRTV